MFLNRMKTIFPKYKDALYKKERLLFSPFHFTIKKEHPMGALFVLKFRLASVCQIFIDLTLSFFDDGIVTGSSQFCEHLINDCIRIIISAAL